MGRKPKDPALQERAGNPGRRPVKRRKPRASRQSWMMPAIQLRPEAQTIWDDLCARWQQLGYIRDVDMPTLSRYATYLAEWVAATEQLQSDGFTIDSETVTGGTLKRLHPAVRMRQTIETNLLQIESQFGFNPNSRQLILARVLGQGSRQSVEQPDMFPDSASAETADPVAFLSEGAKPTAH